MVSVRRELLVFILCMHTTKQNIKYDRLRNEKKLGDIDIKVRLIRAR